MEASGSELSQARSVLILIIMEDTHGEERC